jgi:hypothetical protein
VRQSSLSNERLAALLAWAALRFAPTESAATLSPLTAEEMKRLR